MLSYDLVDMSSGATSTTRRPCNIVWAGVTGGVRFCDVGVPRRLRPGYNAIHTILKLSLGAALRKDVVLIGAVGAAEAGPVV